MSVRLEMSRIKPTVTTISFDRSLDDVVHLFEPLARLLARPFAGVRRFPGIVGDAVDSVGQRLDTGGGPGDGLRLVRGPGGDTFVCHFQSRQVPVDLGRRTAELVQKDRE